MSSVASAAGLIHLGMDTSKYTTMVATLLPGEENPVTDRIANEEAAVRRLVGRFADRSVLRAWYKAGPGLRAVPAAGLDGGAVPGGDAVADPQGRLGQG